MRTKKELCEKLGITYPTLRKLLVENGYEVKKKLLSENIFFEILRKYGKL